MKVVAFNGSPRKNFNTAQLIEKTLEGARSQNAQTELFHLYDIDFKGCISCFSCKMKEGKSYGKCGFGDDLQPYLKKAAEADVLIIGSPVYLSRLSGEAASFLERLILPFLSYADYSSLAPKKIKTAMIYTMNVTEEEKNLYKYDVHFSSNERFMKSTFGSCESLMSFNTLQGNDYDKYLLRGTFKGKTEYREKYFGKDLEKAYELGKRLASNQ